MKNNNSHLDANLLFVLKITIALVCQVILILTLVAITMITNTVLTWSLSILTGICFGFLLGTIENYFNDVRIYYCWNISMGYKLTDKLKNKAFYRYF